MTFRFAVTATDGNARTGVVSTAHGPVPTPAFMPVGSRGAVRAIDDRDLVEARADIVLANTYHLMLRPGAERVAAVGGLHRFMAWDGPILTDSGGFQIFSLPAEITERGAVFRSVYDGSAVSLTPEEAARIQEDLGSDIAMILDVCVGLPAPEGILAEAMHRTLRWTERFLEAHNSEDQAVFGIVQGGTDLSLREASARSTATLPVAGFGIGGLSVGEPPAERAAALDVVVTHLPRERVRYVMGLGDPAGVLDAVGRGADLFDCVWPTRLARHGKVLSSAGDFSIRNAAHAASPAPLDEACTCRVCHRYTRAYLRHLAITREPGLRRLLTIHNLTYTLGLLRDARGAIAEGRFSAFQSLVHERRTSF